MIYSAYIIHSGGNAMEIIKNQVHDSKYIVISQYYKPEDILLFDIETTGFAAEATMVYLIGCVYFEDGNFVAKQWFNDDGESESQIICDFMEFTKKFKYIFHYNGDGFDIPYIEKKISRYAYDYSFSGLISIDIYKKIKPFKKLLHLDNLKQKSIERFLGVNRLDKYSGGDLIKVYSDFLASSNPMQKTLLIQHNYDDLEGLLYSCSMLAYTKLFAGCLVVSKMTVRQNKLVFSLKLDYGLPKRITAGISDILITAFKDEGTISVPILDTELKFFFDNYREYYYLPAEDMAVHKSVASFVDRNYRQPAKKDNCYIRKKGYFITQIDSGIMAGYKYGCKDKESFIELADSFLQDIDMLNAYARHILSLIIK